MSEESLNNAQNIVLVGFMGTGKSTVGKSLAECVGFSFLDTDEQLVEAAGGVSINALFKDEGEDKFRDRETATLRSLSEQRGCVIATGGGIILREENRAILRELGYVVWLDASEATILERVSGCADRPLLDDPDPAARIHDLLAPRLKLYQEVSDLRIEVGELAVADITGGIRDSASFFFSEGGRG